MRTAYTSTSDRTEDRYPSRGGRSAAIRERQDPVVYAKKDEDSPIAPTLVRRYKKLGFLLLKGVFSAEEVTAFQAESDRLRRDPGIQASGETITELGSGDVRSVFKVHAISPVFSKLASDTRMAGMAQYLLGDQVYIHQSRLNYKSGFRGKEFYWHSDFETWHVEDGMPRMRALSMSIILTENTDNNGPLMLIPRSHKHYVVCEGETPENHFKASLKKQEYGVPSDDCLSQMAKAGGIVVAKGKPGSMIIFDCNILHGSNGNISPYPRSNVFIVYNALSNRVGAPFCDKPPRPEYICSRACIEPITPLKPEKLNE
ncbi:ectoine hydroxylase [Microbulbifer sp. 2304DJ12-6]|uniref:ectoine hydroxylase n=1 Tax=Microbulbifer sp. 2304DJ12-6 TaxID=3233340 RepID=UPI0039B0A6D4